MRYNFFVARGWESKSVEDQQAEFAETQNQPKLSLTPEQLAHRRINDGLVLSRKRVLRQLEQAQNPQHKSMLASALADLDAKISQ